MSIHRKVTISCDTPGCEAAYGPGSNAANVRRGAKANGWLCGHTMVATPSVGNGGHTTGDFCPNHYTPHRSPKVGPDEPESQMPWQPFLKKVDELPHPSRAENQKYIGPVPPPRAPKWPLYRDSAPLTD